MADEEVKIRVVQEQQGDALERTRQQLDATADAAKRAQSAGQGGGPSQPTAAAQAQMAELERAEAERQKKAGAAKGDQPRQKGLIADAEEDLARAKATGGDVAARERELRERKLTARFMREQKIGEEPAMEKARSMVDAQSGAREAAEAEKAEHAVLAGQRRAEQTAARNAERQIHGEMQQQTREVEAQERGRVRLGRAMFGGIGGRVGGGLVGGGAMLAASEGFTDFTERQGIGNRDRSQRAGDDRRRSLQSGWRGSSSDSFAQEEALRQSIFEREQNRPELERKANAGVVQGGMAGAAAGAGVGAMLGSIVPVVGTAIGAGAGALIGGGIGAGRNYLSGKRDVDESETSQTREQEELEKQRAETRRKFAAEEGGVEMHMAEARGRHNVEGMKAVRIDEMKLAFAQRYRQLMKETGGDDAIASRGGELAVKERQWQLQQNAAGGLVNARSGAADIARASSIASNALPGADETTREIRSMHHSLKGAYDAQTQAVTRHDFSPAPL